jgi:8-oxo-dGTP pyrophosphatase MutT (NUDIX family)
MRCSGGTVRSVDGESMFRGRFIDVRRERFRHNDGEVVTREIVRHPGAVGIVAYDEETLWLVRQPREAVAEEALLEIPAGLLDVAGESPEQAARRELAEEIGCGARNWGAILSYYSSAGFSDECVHLFYATELFPREASPDEGERIEVVRWPLGDLDGAISQTRDAKTLIGLMWLARRADRGATPGG